jgi:hypothetical protein
LKNVADTLSDRPCESQYLYVACRQRQQGWKHL